MIHEAAEAYDEVPYPSAAHVQTHPDRLSTIARLYGLRPPAVARCRVLELGCGDGTNLIAMAYVLPESTFLGIDLAACPIKEGNRTIAELGLRNIRLEQRDITGFRASPESFDYIIAHGVYSWVPAGVRDRLLGICHDSLSKNGIAYVSYNAYPGCHLRDLAREMMLFHVRDCPTAHEKVAQGRSLLAFLAGSKEPPDLYRLILQKELKTITERNDSALYHDDLAPISHPVYLHQFLAHAAQHGLQFLGDAMFNEMQPEDYTPSALATLRALGDNITLREQYLDFLMCRRFRRTLLCHRQAPLDHRPHPEVVADLYAAADLQTDSSEPDIQSPVIEEFRGRKGASIQTNRALDKAALSYLSECWPRSVHFSEVKAAARRLASSAEGTHAEEKDTAALSDLLLRAYAAGIVELHCWTPPLVTQVSDRPVSSPVARLENRQGKRVTTLRHTGLELSDEISRALLDLLDGSRDLNALVDSLAASIESGNAQIDRDGRPVTDPAEIHALLASELPLALQRLARCGLLAS